jgi:hypothetical protein
VPAQEFDPQSDLGARLVTREVGALSGDEIAQALSDGETEARRLFRAGRVAAAALHLRGETRVVAQPQLISSFAASPLPASNAS